MSDDDAIRALIRHWHAATAAGDIDAVAALVDTDAEFIAPGRDPLVGREALEAGLRAVLETHRIEPQADVQEVRVSGDLAFAVARLSVRMSPRDGGEATSRSGYALSVFRRQADGGWRLIRDANMLVPQG